MKPRPNFKKLRWAALIGALLAGSVLVAPAKACACSASDPRDEFARADAAMVGTFGSRESSPGTSVYRFTVTEDLKDNLGETVDVRAATRVGDCGLKVEPGHEYGVFLKEQNGQYHSTYCMQMSPRAARGAARPLPAPDGVGEARALVGGSFGDQRTIALDPQARTLAYGGDDGDVVSLSVCPGSQLVTELVNARADLGSDLFTIRSLPDLSPQSEFGVPTVEGVSPYAIHCPTQDASRIYIALKDRNPNRIRIMAIQGQQSDFVFDGAGSAVSFNEHMAFVLGRGRDRIVSVDLSTGKTRTFLRLNGKGGPPAVAPGGDRLAFTLRRDGRTEIRAVELAGASSTSSILLSRRIRSGDIVWIDEGRFAFLHGRRATIYGADLAAQGSLRRWASAVTAPIGDGLLGVRLHRARSTLIVADLSTGAVEKVRSLPSPVVNALAAVP